MAYQAVGRKPHDWAGTGKPTLTQSSHGLLILKLLRLVVICRDPLRVESSAVSGETSHGA